MIGYGELKKMGFLVFIIVLPILILLLVLILKPDPLKKARREADRIILTKQENPERIRQVLNELIILGLYEKVTDTESNSEEFIQKQIQETNNFNEALQKSLELMMGKTIDEDENRIRKLQEILKEAGDS